MRKVKNENILSLQPLLYLFLTLTLYKKWSLLRNNFRNFNDHSKYSLFKINMAEPEQTI